MGSRLPLAVALSLLAAQWVHALAGVGGPAAEDLFGRWTYDAIGAVSGMVVLLRGLDARIARGPWLALGAGLVSKSVGDVIYSLAGNLSTVPVPSASDGFWLTFYPCAYLALMLLVRSRVRPALAATHLDGLICGVTVAAALACATLPTAFSTSAGAPLWERATDLAYPIGDLVLMGAIVSAVALSGWRIDRTLGVLAAAIVAWEAADLMYMFSASGSAGDIADAIVLSGVCGMALAATLDRPSSRRGDDDDRGLFVPVAFGAAALAILFGGAALGLEIVGLALAAVALALLLIRMALALAENRALMGASRMEAKTDPLTGLGNRRALKQALSAIFAQDVDRSGLALVLLDLNGFKAYNDTFGHAAGDMLLTRLGVSLASSVRGRGAAYRLGGDEFCVLGACSQQDAGELSSLCAEALATRGEGFAITAAHGVVLLPAEAQEPSAALALADSRMYAQKRRGARGDAPPGRAERHRQDGDPGLDPREARSSLTDLVSTASSGPRAR